MYYKTNNDEMWQKYCTTNENMISDPVYVTAQYHNQLVHIYKLIHPPTQTMKLRNIKQHVTEI